MKSQRREELACGGNGTWSAPGPYVLAASHSLHILVVLTNSRPAIGSSAPRGCCGLGRAAFTITTLLRGGSSPPPQWLCQDLCFLIFLSSSGLT